MTGRWTKAKLIVGATGIAVFLICQIPGLTIAAPQQPAPTSSEAPAAKPKPAEAGPKNLDAEDRDKIRALHVRAWQAVAKIKDAELARFQAQTELDALNREIEHLTRELAESHGAQGYVLAPDFRWVKPAPPKPGNNE